MLPGETQHNLDQLEKLALSKDTNLHKLLVRLCQEDEYLSAEEVANIEVTYRSLYKLINVALFRQLLFFFFFWGVSLY